MATSFSGERSRNTRKEPPTVGQATCKLDHFRLRVEWTIVCNLKSWVRTHAVLVIDLYELLGNATT
jgi:hypothetical protein